MEVFERLLFTCAGRCRPSRLSSRIYSCSHTRVHQPHDPVREAVSFNTLPTPNLVAAAHTSPPITIFVPTSSPPTYLLPLHTPFKNPSRWLSRLTQSSDSPMARTKPHSAYTWFSPVYRPFSSTLPTEICTLPWSLAWMMRFVALHLRGT